MRCLAALAAGLSWHLAAPAAAQECGAAALAVGFGPAGRRFQVQLDLGDVDKLQTTPLCEGFRLQGGDGGPVVVGVDWLADARDAEVAAFASNGAACVVATDGGVYYSSWNTSGSLCREAGARAGTASNDAFAFLCKDGTAEVVIPGPGGGAGGGATDDVRRMGSVRAAYSGEHILSLVHPDFSVRSLVPGDGQAAAGTVIERLESVALDADEVAQVAATANDVVALLGNSTVVAWGSSYISRNVPQQVLAGGVGSLGSARDTAAAVVNGSVILWGRFAETHFLNPAGALDVQVPPLSGARHALHVRVESQRRCLIWGLDAFEDLASCDQVAIGTEAALVLDRRSGTLMPVGTLTALVAGRALLAQDVVEVYAVGDVFLAEFSGGWVTAWSAQASAEEVVALNEPMAHMSRIASVHCSSQACLLLGPCAESSNATAVFSMVALVFCGIVITFGAFLAGRSYLRSRDHANAIVPASSSSSSDPRNRRSSGAGSVRRSSGGNVIDASRTAHKRPKSSPLPLFTSRVRSIGSSRGSVGSEDAPAHPSPLWAPNDKASFGRRATSIGSVGSPRGGCGDGRRRKLRKKRRRHSLGTVKPDIMPTVDERPTHATYEAGSSTKFLAIPPFARMPTSPKSAPTGHLG